MAFSAASLCCPKTQMSKPGNLKSVCRLQTGNEEIKCVQRQTTVIVLMKNTRPKEFRISKPTRRYHNNCSSSYTITGQHKHFRSLTHVNYTSPTAPSSDILLFFCWHSSSVVHWFGQKRGHKRKSSPCPDGSYAVIWWHHATRVKTRGEWDIPQGHRRCRCKSCREDSCWSITVFQSKNIKAWEEKYAFNVASRTAQKKSRVLITAEMKSDKWHFCNQNKSIF